MKSQTKNYNDLIPPANPLYPWKAEDWQLLCYYCAEPIYQTIPVAGHRQRTIYMRGRWLHGATVGLRLCSDLYCDLAKLRPDSAIDDPRCYVCGTQTNKHADHCSACGMPRYRATPMSDKESELIALFGWRAAK